MTLNEKIAELCLAGEMTYGQIGEMVGLTASAVKARWHRYRKSKGITKKHSDARRIKTSEDEIERVRSDERVVLGIPVSMIVNELKAGPRTLRDLSKKLDRSEDTVSNAIDQMILLGYGLKVETNWVTMPPKPIQVPDIPALFTSKKEFEFSFGLISDTHSGSRFEQVTALKDFGKIAKEEYGVDILIHCGDATAGNRVYRGQEMDVYSNRAVDQAEAAACNLPEGFSIYMLGGNHDYSFYRQTGIDVRHEIIRAGRDDITLLPYDAYDLPLLPNIDARLWHPAGGPAYAISYKGQKYSEQLAGDEIMKVIVGDKEVPTIVLVLIGHFHKTFWFAHGGIQVFGAGCFEGQTSYLKRKGLIPMVGGVIIKCKFIGGFLHRVESARITYREIENDWKAWWARRQPKQKEVTRLETIFKLDEHKDS